MPSANRPGAASAIEATALGEARRGPRVGGHDRRAEPQAGLPRRRQRQRGEGVGAVGLGRPDVGVAEVGELGQPRRAGRAAGRGAGRSCRGGSAASCRRHFGTGQASRQNRTMPTGWRSPAACRPRPTGGRGRGRSPAATACTRMSSSTHSVGTSRHTRSVLSRLLPPARDAERLTDRPSARSRRGSPARSRRRLGITSGSRAHSSVWPSPCSLPSRSSHERALSDPLLELVR